MTQYQLKVSTSPTQALTVTSYPIIINLAATWPSSPQIPGAALSVVFTFKNGGGPGVVTFTLKNGATTLGTANVAVQEGTTLTQSGSINFAMPAADANLALTSNYGGSVSAIIQALTLVNTTLTLTLPASVQVNAPVALSGKLTRADAGAVGVQLINVYNTATGLTVATVNTDANGNYSGSFAAPSIAGSYNYAASFSGSGILSASIGYGRVGIGAAVDWVLWGLLGLITAAVIWNDSKKKR